MRSEAEEVSTKARQTLRSSHSPGWSDAADMRETCEELAAASDQAPSGMILLLCAAAVVPPLPHPTSVFTAHTIEYDDTLNGTLIVKQTLYRDNDAKRQYMIADGSLAHDHLEETMRCELQW